MLDDVNYLKSIGFDLFIYKTEHHLYRRRDIFCKLHNGKWHVFHKILPHGHLQIDVGKLHTIDIIKELKIKLLALVEAQINIISKMQ